MKTSISLLLLFFSLNTFSQIKPVIDTSGRYLYATELLHFNGRVTSLLDNQPHFQITDTIASRLVSNGYGVDGFDSIFYYHSPNDSVFMRYRTDSSKWYKYEGIYAFRPVVHKGVEYFVEAIKDSLGNFYSWRLCKIVADTIQKGVLKPVLGHELESNYRSIVFKRSYRTGGLFSTGKQLMLTLLREDSIPDKHFQLFIGEVASIDSVKPIQSIRALDDDWVPLTESPTLLYDSILVFQIKELTSKSRPLNTGISRVSALNLRSGSYKTIQVNPHSYFASTGKMVYFDYYIYEPIQDSFYLLNEVIGNHYPSRHIQLLGHDDSGRVYFNPKNNLLDIWRTDLNQSNQVFQDTATNIAYTPSVSLVRDSILAFQYRKSGDNEILILNIYNGKKTFIELADSFDIPRAEYKLSAMEIDSSTNSLYFISNGPGPIGQVFYSVIPNWQNNTSLGGNSNYYFFEVFPNPTKQNVYLNSPENLTNIQLSDVLGKAMDALIIQTDQGFKIDLSKLQKGLYLIHFEINGQAFSQKIIKD